MYNNFSKELQDDIDRYIAEGKTIESFLKTHCEVSDLNQLDFDIKDKNQNDFGFQKVRGNVNLMMGNIRTYQESQDLIEAALEYDFKPLTD